MAAKDNGIEFTIDTKNTPKEVGLAGGPHTLGVLIEPTIRTLLNQLDINRTQANIAERIRAIPSIVTHSGSVSITGIHDFRVNNADGTGNVCSPCLSFVVGFQEVGQRSFDLEVGFDEAFQPVEDAIRAALEGHLPDLVVFTSEA